MKIFKVKKIGDKYLINNKILVPLVPDNRYYKKLSEWLKSTSEDMIEKEPAIDVNAKAVESEFSERKNKLLQSVQYDMAMPSWETQRMEAILNLYMQEAPTPFIDGLAEARGETTRVVAKRILNKSNDYLNKLGKITGQMQIKLKK